MTNTLSERCAKGYHNRKGAKIVIFYWKEGDDALRFKWNKVGQESGRAFICSDCGFEQHYFDL